MSGVCWYCFWGWPKPVAETYNRALAELGESILRYGPSHIVFEDENFDDNSVEFCIEQCDRKDLEYSADELAGLKIYLEELLAIPEEIRDPEPEDCDYPENYPPQGEMVKV